MRDDELGPHVVDPFYYSKNSSSSFSLGINTLESLTLNQLDTLNDLPTLFFQVTNAVGASGKVGLVKINEFSVSNDCLFFMLGYCLV